MLAGVGYEDGRIVRESEIHELALLAFGSAEVAGKKILVIIPDGTRTAPIGVIFRAICKELSGRAAALDYLVALGTHQPMSEEAIRERVGISPEERRGRYGKIRFFNHAWDDPAALETVGTIPAAEIRDLTGGLFEMEVRVTANAMLSRYDLLIIVGPVFPHEVVGFSGGNKYLFPGVAGEEIIGFFHWLGAVVTNPRIIGNKDTVTRRVVERCARMVRTPKLCFAMVSSHAGLHGLYIDEPEAAWSAAADLSAKLHVVYKGRPYKSVLSCAPRMYDDLWTGGKCMYKLEPVVADGGELIIYAPHITEISYTHGRVLDRVGYHVRDYFLKRWDEFKGFPWGVLAHSTHVKGIGAYDGQVERPRVDVVLATGIPEARCRAVNLGYRDPATIDPKEWRGNQGRLLVEQAGETLYRLKNPPSWQRP